MRNGEKRQKDKGRMGEKKDGNIEYQRTIAI